MEVHLILDATRSPHITTDNDYRCDIKRMVENVVHMTRVFGDQVKIELIIFRDYGMQPENVLLYNHFCAADVERAISNGLHVMPNRTSFVTSGQKTALIRTIRHVERYPRKTPVVFFLFTDSIPHGLIEDNSDIGGKVVDCPVRTAAENKYLAQIGESSEWSSICERIKRTTATMCTFLTNMDSSNEPYRQTWKDAYRMAGHIVLDTAKYSISGHVLDCLWLLTGLKPCDPHQGPSEETNLNPYPIVANLRPKTWTQDECQVDPPTATAVSDRVEELVEMFEYARAKDIDLFDFVDWIYAWRRLCALRYTHNEKYKRRIEQLHLAFAEDMRWQELDPTQLLAWYGNQPRIDACLALQDNTHGTEDQEYLVWDESFCPGMKAQLGLKDCVKFARRLQQANSFRDQFFLRLQVVRRRPLQGGSGGLPMSLSNLMLFQCIMHVMVPGAACTSLRGAIVMAMAVSEWCRHIPTLVHRAQTFLRSIHETSHWLDWREPGNRTLLFVQWCRKYISIPADHPNAIGLQVLSQFHDYRSKRLHYVQHIPSTSDKRLYMTVQELVRLFPALWKRIWGFTYPPRTRPSSPSVEQLLEAMVFPSTEWCKTTKEVHTSSHTIEELRTWSVEELTNLYHRQEKCTSVSRRGCKLTLEEAEGLVSQVVLDHFECERCGRIKPATKLQSACGTCLSSVCNTCLKRWYGKTVLGCYPVQGIYLLCPCCRGVPSKDTLRKFHPHLAMQWPSWLVNDKSWRQLCVFPGPPPCIACIRQNGTCHCRSMDDWLQRWSCVACVKSEKVGHTCKVKPDKIESALCIGWCRSCYSFGRKDEEPNVTSCTDFTCSRCLTSRVQ